MAQAQIFLHRPLHALRLQCYSYSVLTLKWDRIARSLFGMVSSPPAPEVYPLTPDAPVQFGPFMGPGKGNVGPYGLGPPGFGDSNPSQHFLLVPAPP